MSETPGRKLRYGTIDPDYGLKLATTPPEDDGPVWMVNLMRYREVAEYADGREATISGKEADDEYAPLESLAAIGAEVVFFGKVDTQLLGDSPQWDRIGVVKYPTRRSFIEMQSRPDFKEKHVHKEAGMAETIVMGTIPFAGPFIAEGAPDWADVPHPPTDEDGPITVLHVIRFKEGDVSAEGDAPASGDGHMAAYEEAAGAVAVPHGVRIGGWFGVEGTIVGDGRTWDQVRFNQFPSKAAFLAVALDPDRLAAQGEHREAAIEDTYALIVRARIDKIAESAAAHLG